MFKNQVNETPMTSDGANILFGERIYGDSFLSDKTFVSTLRALLGNTRWGKKNPTDADGGRMGDDDTLYFKMSSITGLSASGAEEDPTEFIGRLCPDGWENNSLTLINLNTPRKEEFEMMFKAIEEKFTEVYTEFVYAPKPTLFYKKGFPCYCFIDESTKRSVVIVGTVNTQKYHFLQTAIIAYLPWYFPQERGISPEEMELIDCLKNNQKDSNDYIQVLKKFADRYDFRGAAIHKLLTGFETKFLAEELDSVRKAVEDCADYIAEYQSRIRDKMRDRDKYIAQSEGILKRMTDGGEGSNELRDYFMANKNVEIRNLTSEELTFAARGELEFFDEDVAECYINNYSSILYKNGNSEYLPSVGLDNMKRLWTAVLIDRTVKINLCAGYTLFMRGQAQGLKHYDFGGDYMDCFPNPHIDEYRCLGGNQVILDDMLKSLDYVGVIQQCMVSVRNLNFDDGVVMSEFMRRITGTGGHRVNRNCFVFPDGKVYNIEGAAKRLEEEAKDEKAE